MQEDSSVVTSLIKPKNVTLAILISAIFGLFYCKSSLNNHLAIQVLQLSDKVVHSPYSQVIDHAVDYYQAGDQVKQEPNSEISEMDNTLTTEEQNPDRFNALSEEGQISKSEIEPESNHPSGEVSQDIESEIGNEFQNNEEQSQVSEITNGKNSSSRYILIFYQSAELDHLIKDTHHFFACPYNNCIATKDKNLFGLNNEHLFDAVITEPIMFKSEEDAAKLVGLHRRPEQFYILRTFEAPWRYDWVLGEHLPMNFFNLTWSVFQDSDIPDSYGGVFRHVNENFNDGIHEYEKPVESFQIEESSKTHLAIWVVSHCKTVNKRESYVEELQKYVQVDVFGACGKPMTCPDIGNCSELMTHYCSSIESDNKCKLLVESRYKFYLAFENSHCDDYWTEKLTHCFEFPIVPVVMGGANYTHVLPKGAFINVDDFSGPQELATYLKYLDENWDEYLKYFEWRENYIKYSPRAYCKLCEIANKPEEYSHIVPNITRWFFFHDDLTPRCHDPAFNPSP